MGDWFWGDFIIFRRGLLRRWSSIGFRTAIFFGGCLATLPNVATGICSNERSAGGVLCLRGRVNVDEVEAGAGRV